MNLSDFQAANSPSVGSPLLRQFAATPEDTPRFTIGGSTLDFATPRQQKEAQKIKTAFVENVATPVTNALTDPFYAATPGMDQRRQDARKRILEKVAAVVTDPMAATFAGVGAKMADKAALARSMEMKAAGVADDAIWKETGWTHGFPDGKARFEIDDSAAKFNLKNAPVDEYGAQEMGVYNALEHPELAKNYPQNADVTVQHWPSEEMNGGFYQPADRNIILGRESVNKDVMLHENQHLVQDTEGFARGGNPSEFDFSKSQPALSKIYQEVGTNLANRYMELGKQGVIDFANDPQIIRLMAEKQGYEKTFPEIMKSPTTTYRSLAGEVEARLTQRRMDLTAEQRRGRYPISEMDVPVDQQIVRFGGGRAESAAPPRMKLYRGDSVNADGIGQGSFGDLGSGHYLVDSPHVAEYFTDGSNAAHTRGFEVDPGNTFDLMDRGLKDNPRVISLVNDMPDGLNKTLVKRWLNNDLDVRDGYTFLANATGNTPETFNSVLAKYGFDSVATQGTRGVADGGKQYVIFDPKRLAPSK